MCVRGRGLTRALVTAQCSEARPALGVAGPSDGVARRTNRCHRRSSRPVARQAPASRQLVKPAPYIPTSPSRGQCPATPAPRGPRPTGAPACGRRRRPPGSGRPPAGGARPSLTARAGRAWRAARRGAAGRTRQAESGRTGLSCSQPHAPSPAGLASSGAKAHAQRPSQRLIYPPPPRAGQAGAPPAAPAAASTPFVASPVLAPSPEPWPPIDLRL